MPVLNNIKVLIPRPVGRTDEMADKLSALGATPILFPLIEITAINQDELKSTCRDHAFDWIIFTSGIAVQVFFDNIDTKTVTSKIAVVGTSTQKAVEQLGLKVDFVPSAATAKKLMREIPVNPGEQVLIPRSKIAGKEVLKVLQKRKVQVTEIATYDNTPVNYSKEQVEEVLAQNINVIAFTSASTADSFFGLLQKHRIKLYGPHLVAIGPSTASALQQHRQEVAATAEEHNIDGLVAVIAGLYQ
ncbi:MAG: uroporphyrinogen-III synthase [Flavobacteriales bacterium]|nr:uroporphyrinogen-III synthase [Flavobacteriales bacterium]